MRLLPRAAPGLQVGAEFQFPFLVCDLAEGRDCVLTIFVTPQPTANRREEGGVLKSMDF